MKCFECNVYNMKNNKINPNKTIKLFIKILLLLLYAQKKTLIHSSRHFRLKNLSNL
jgi:hypothetical protein